MSKKTYWIKIEAKDEDDLKRGITDLNDGKNGCRVLTYEEDKGQGCPCSRSW